MAGRVRWSILATIIFASFVAYILRTNFSIVSERMIHDLGMTTAQYGYAAAAFALGYALFQFPGGIVGNRFGPRRTIAVIATAWAVLTAVTALVPGSQTAPLGIIVVLLVLTRFLVGAVHAPFFPVTLGGTVEKWFPPREWGIANGLSSAGLTLGAALTAPLVVWLMTGVGWRGALLLTAPAGLLAAWIYYTYVTDEPRQHARIGEAELRLISSDRPAAREVASVAWPSALRDRNVLLIALSYFCMNYVFYLFFSWFFFYLVEVRQFSAFAAGQFTSAQWILGAAGAALGGFACDRLVRHLGVRKGTRVQTMAGLILSGTFLYFGAMSDDVTLAVVFLCCSFGCNQLTEAPIWVATMSVSRQHAQLGTGVLNTGGNIPGVIGGLAVPAIAEVFGWPAAIASGSLFAFVGAALWLFIRADEPMVELPAKAD